MFFGLTEFDCALKLLLWTTLTVLTIMVSSSVDLTSMTLRFTMTMTTATTSTIATT